MEMVWGRVMSADTEQLREQQTRTNTQPTR